MNDFTSWFENAYGMSIDHYERLWRNRYDTPFSDRYEQLIKEYEKGVE